MSCSYSLQVIVRADFPRAREARPASRLHRVGRVAGSYDKPLYASTTGDYTPANNAFAGTTIGRVINLDGLNGGLQAGYNWQTGISVLGVEGDFQAVDQNWNLVPSFDERSEALDPHRDRHGGDLRNHDLRFLIPP